eukprot:15459359-Alexandrium_andersonii.AAC.1
MSPVRPQLHDGRGMLPDGSAEVLDDGRGAIVDERHGVLLDGRGDVLDRPSSSVSPNGRVAERGL